jgi:hypothetical protein
MLMRRAVVFACLLAIVGLTVSSPSDADTFRRTNYITFNKPVRLPGVVLTPGTYIFELPEPMDAWDVVRVSSRDRQHVYYSGFTYAVSRPAGLPHDRVVSFDEAPANAALPIRTWWPIGESTGRQFKYADNR